MNRNTIGLAIFPVVIVLAVALGISCTGPNPADAPFGSTVIFIEEPGDFTIPPNTQVIIPVAAVVLDPEGFPINDIKVDWRLTFANQNDLVFDTDGDGIADSHALQFVDPDACEEVGLDCEEVDSSLYPGFGALKDSPLRLLTDDRGVTRVLILAFGDFPVDPASLTVSISTFAESVEFSVTN